MAWSMSRPHAAMRCHGGSKPSHFVHRQGYLACSLGALPSRGAWMMGDRRTVPALPSTELDAKIRAGAVVELSWPFHALLLIAATVAFALVFVAAELLHLRGITADTTRRAAHVTGSAAAAVVQAILSLPDLIMLAFGFGAFLLGTRVLGRLPSIHAVSRPTAGAPLLPLGLLAAAFAGGEHHAATAFGMLALGLADPLAAVAGKTESPSWQIPGGRKSVSGSAGFFATALCLAAIFTVASGHVQPFAVAGVAIVLTAVEAGSGFGLDNLLVPAIGTVTARFWLGL